jgi:hypothetical protein
METLKSLSPPSNLKMAMVAASWKMTRLFTIGIQVYKRLLLSTLSIATGDTTLASQEYIIPKTNRSFIVLGHSKKPRSLHESYILDPNNLPFNAEGCCAASVKGLWRLLPGEIPRNKVMSRSASALRI